MDENFDAGFSLGAFFEGVVAPVAGGVLVVVAIVRDQCTHAVVPEDFVCNCRGLSAAAVRVVREYGRIGEANTFLDRRDPGPR